MQKEYSEKQQRFMERWGILKEDICLYTEEDMDVDAEIVEVDYDEYE